ncbi:MAG: hypothetical protein AB7V42_03870 [Thermoleophilia bacterium]
MSLRLSDDHNRLLGDLDGELRAAAEAIGLALGGQLTRLAPALTRPAEGDEADARLAALDLEHEDAPDGVSLAACLAAHRAYVASRGDPSAVSAGALALGRLLVWGQRAALLGPAPRIVWLGPPARRPERSDVVALRATCALEMAGATRRAAALALIAAPAGD